MASSCIELFVKFAAGIGLMKEFHRPSPGEDLEANNGNGANHHGIGNYFQRTSWSCSCSWWSRIEIFPFFFFLIDILDVALDIIFSLRLFILGEPGYGVLMIVMTAISVSIWSWSRGLIHQAIDSEFSTGTIRTVMCFSEMAMFFTQDATTIFIFTKVPESYDYYYEGDIFSAINLVITIICGASLVVFQVYLSCKKEGGCRMQRCRCSGRKVLTFFFFLCNMAFLTTTLALAFEIYATQFLWGGWFYYEELDMLYGIPCGLWLLFTLRNWFVMSKEENRDMGEEFWSKIGLELLCVRNDG